MKVELDIVKMTLERNELEAEKRKQILEDLQAVLDAEAEAKDDKPPAVKKQYVALVAIKTDEEKYSIQALPAWVLQIPEGEPVEHTTSHILEAAYEYNRTPKGRRMPLQTIGEAMQVLPTKIAKERGFWIKTREMVQIETCANQLPKE